MEIKNIPITKIRVNEDAIRKCDPENPEFIALKESIKSAGRVYQNIQVTPRAIQVPFVDENGVESVRTEQVYLLLNGLQRFTAVTELAAEDPDNPAWKTLPAGILAEVNDLEAATIQLVTNFNVKMAPSQIANHLTYMLQLNPSWTIGQLAKQISQTSAWVEKYLSLRKLEEVIMKQLDEGLIPVSNAVQLAKLPPEERVNFLERARTEATNEFTALVANRLAELKQATNEGRAPRAEGFVPTPKLRPVKDILAMRESGKLAQSMLGRGLTESDIVNAVLDWALELDEASQKSKRAAYDAKQAEIEERKIAKNAARLQKLGVELTAEQQEALNKQGKE